MKPDLPQELLNEIEVNRDVLRMALNLVEIYQTCLVDIYQGIGTNPVHAAYVALCDGKELAEDMIRIQNKANDV